MRPSRTCDVIKVTGGAGTTAGTNPGTISITDVVPVRNNENRALDEDVLKHHYYGGHGGYGGGYYGGCYRIN